MFNFENDDDDGTPFFSRSYNKGSLFQSQAQQQTSAFDLFNNNKVSKRSIIDQLDNFNKNEAFYSLIDEQDGNNYQKPQYNHYSDQNSDKNKQMDISFQNVSSKWNYQPNEQHYQTSEQNQIIQSKQQNKSQIPGFNKNDEHNEKKLKFIKNQNSFFLKNQPKKEPIQHKQILQKKIIQQENNKIAIKKQESSIIKDQKKNQAAQPKRGFKFQNSHKLKPSNKLDSQQAYYNNNTNKIALPVGNQQQQKHDHNSPKKIIPYHRVQQKDNKQKQAKKQQVSKHVKNPSEIKKPMFAFNKKASVETTGLKAQIAKKQSKNTNGNSLKFYQLKPRESINKLSISKYASNEEPQFPTSIKVVKKVQADNNNIKTTFINKKEKYEIKNNLCYSKFLESFEEIANQVKTKKQAINRIKQDYKTIYAISNYHSQLIRDNLKTSEK